jgi:hypothetical protein
LEAAVKLSRWIPLLSLAVLFGPARTAHAELITTMPNWGGSHSITAFGQPNTATYGQTITVGTDNVLSSFTFQVNTLSDLGPTHFSAYVMEWNDALNMVVGPILYQSGPMTNPNDGSFHGITVNPNIALQTGSQYVLFFNCSNEFDGQDDFAAFGAVDNYADVYAGGKFVFLNNADDFGALMTDAWFDATHLTGDAWDLAFSAQLVPAPTGLVLAGMGAAGLIVLRRMRRKPLV